MNKATFHFLRFRFRTTKGISEKSEAISRCSVDNVPCTETFTSYICTCLFVCSVNTLINQKCIFVNTKNKVVSNSICHFLSN